MRSISSSTVLFQSQSSIQDTCLNVSSEVNVRQSEHLNDESILCITHREAAQYNHSVICWPLEHLGVKGLAQGHLSSGD